MKEYDGIYEFSTEEGDEGYGLYIMEVKCSLHTESSYLMYYFDGDSFIHRGEGSRKLFSNPSQLKSCKDEFGNTYTGTALKSRMLEAVKAYIEELPSYQAYVIETDEKLSQCD